ncbi:MAG: beta-lactamase family protein [Novosphingobium sp.]|nr:beta-lactamase family protein [Novosphingobium sp.]
MSRPCHFAARVFCIALSAGGEAMDMRGLVLFAAMAIASLTPRAHAREELSDMTDVLREQKVESVSVALIRGGRLVARAAWGMAAPDRPATPDTTYNLASLTKPLTAEIILRLASAGKLSLDEPMDRYWSDPDLSDDPRRLMLTPRLALSHRTGFPNWRAESGLAFERDPGGAWGYSGEGYQYAARFTERRTGKPFAALAERWLFRPVGMRHSGYVSAQGAPAPRALPHDDAGAPLPDHAVTRYNAADLAHATAPDYALFLIDVMKNRRVAPSIAAERVTLQADMRDVVCAGAKAAGCPPWVGFGLGWQLLGFPDGTVMMHTGKDPGFFSFAAIDRASGNGIVILTNSDNGWRTILPVLERTGADPALVRFLRAQID